MNGRTSRDSDDLIMPKKLPRTWVIKWVVVT